MSLTNYRYPYETVISTTVWPSAAVENISDLDDGIVEFLGIRVVIKPPSVSTPSDKGVTSSNKICDTEPEITPD